MSEQPQNPYGTPRTLNDSVKLASRSRFWFVWRCVAIVLFVTSALPLAICIYLLTLSSEFVGADGTIVHLENISIKFVGTDSIHLSSEQAAATCGAIWVFLLVLAVILLIRSRHRSAS